MQLYYVKHKLMKRIGQPLYLLHDHYHEEYDANTIKEIDGFGDTIKCKFTDEEVLKLKQYGFTIGMTMGTEWEIVKVEDVKNGI